MTLVYFLVGSGLALCCGTRLQKNYPRVLLALMLATVVVPVLADQSMRNIIQAGTMLFALSVEGVFRHAPYQFASDDNLKNVAFVSFKRFVTVFTKIYVVSAIATWTQPSWSLSGNGAPLWLQIVVTLFALDLYNYLYHVGQHRFDPWWHFHKLHHATEEMTAFASGRTHVVDFALKQSGVALVVYLLGLSPEAYIYGFLLPVLLIDGLEHANIDFPGKRMRWLAYVFVSPNGHALHHTPTDDRVNYGLLFAIWDVMFGTFKLPESRPASFGLKDRAWGLNGLWWQHFEPVRALLPRLRTRARSLGTS